MQAIAKKYTRKHLKCGLYVDCIAHKQAQGYPVHSRMLAGNKNTFTF